MCTLEEIISDYQKFFPEYYQIVDKNHEESTVYEAFDYGTHQLQVNKSFHSCI